MTMARDIMTAGAECIGESCQSRIQAYADTCFSAVDPGRAPGFADQRLQIVVQHQTHAGFDHQPFVPGDFDSVVMDHQIRGVQHHPHPPSDQPHRHRVGPLSRRQRLLRKSEAPSTVTRPATWGKSVRASRSAVIAPQEASTTT